MAVISKQLTPVGPDESLEDDIFDGLDDPDAVEVELEVEDLLNEEHIEELSFSVVYGDDPTNERIEFVLRLQDVYLFPPLDQFDPCCLRLALASREPNAAVACLLGFFKMVCETGYQQVVRASRLDRLLLHEVPVSSLFEQGQLGRIGEESFAEATLDDFYMLLSLMLCQFGRLRGIEFGALPFDAHITALLELFPAVSERSVLALYDEEKVEAIERFGEQWSRTRAALCSALLEESFQGAMQQVQKYVTTCWRFAGMEYTRLFPKFLHGFNSWFLDLIPQLRTRAGRFEAFIMAYIGLGDKAPYMVLLNLPEAATAQREYLGMHVAAAYALAVAAGDWMQIYGVPCCPEERAVYAEVTEILRTGYAALVKIVPRTEPRTDDGNEEDSVDVAGAGEAEASPPAAP